MKNKHPFIISFIGWSGTVVLIGAYALNSFGIISSQGILYPIFNLYAALALGVRVYADRNYANVTLEVFWGIIAVVSLVRSLF